MAHALRKTKACSFADHLSRAQIKLLKSKGERISHLVSQLQGEAVASSAISDNPFYRGFFQCWNEQRYYEAHDVLEQLWLKTKVRGRELLQGIDSSRGGVRSFTKTIPASDPSQTWPAVVARRSFVSTGRAEPRTICSRAPWPRCRGVAIEIMRARGNNCRVSVRSESLVPGDCAKVEAVVGGRISPQELALPSFREN